MDRRLIPVLLVATLLFSACILPSERRYAQPESDPPEIAELSASHTRTQAVLIENEKVGYLFTFLEVPQETGREQQAPAGTAFIKDLDFKNIGYITPMGQTFRYIENQRTREVCHHNIRKNLAVFFGKPDALVELHDI